MKLLDPIALTMIILFFLGYATISEAQTRADDFSVMGWVGESTGNVGHKGWWAQPPLPYDWDDTGTAKGVELGYRATKWLRVSVGYFDRGKTSGNGWFVSDRSYDYGRGDYVNDPEKWWASWRTTLKGYTFSLDPTFRVSKNLELYGQYGMSKFVGKFWIDRCGYDEYGCYHNPGVIDNHGWPDDKDKPFVKRDWSEYIAVGFTYKGLDVSYYKTDRERGGIGPFQGNEGYRVGYRWEF